ncbi:MAG: 50S ribosome-binding GTPase, partial [Bacteroidaceae bacterium]|nr:50S ribosome-binding GTPase [Bacteroidaceae bacterium]
MRLSELKIGEKAIVVKVLGRGAFRKRIIEMGFVRGQEVVAELNAPLRDPIKFKIMDYEVSLRRSEANLIEVVTNEESQSVEPLVSHGTTADDYTPAHVAELKGKTINIALVGNPNCGKTSLFNVASGANEHVGNYSGVTVDAKAGHFDYKGYRINIFDLPGTYSLSTYTPEELYVRRYLNNEMPDVIVNVVVASNLE